MSLVPCAGGRAGRIGEWIARGILFGLLSYGFLYFGYKYYVPWTGGGNDFAHYYAMIERPLDFEAAPAPWVYRQLNALIAQVPYRLGLQYPTEVLYDRFPEYEGRAFPDKRIFFAALFTNYVFLVACAVLVTFAVRGLGGRGRRSEDVPVEILGGLLVFFSFGTLTFVLTGLTEGLTWALTTAGVLAYLARNHAVLGVVLLLSVFQREILPVVIGGMAAVDYLLLRRRERFPLHALAIAFGVFGFYLVLRGVLLPVEGSGHQMSPSLLLERLFDVKRLFAPAFLVETFMSQNILLVMAGAVLWRMRRGAGFDQVARVAVLVAVGAAIALLVSHATRANIGRIVTMLHPMACAVIAACWLPMRAELPARAE
jgi:hypothetical protein